MCHQPERDRTCAHPASNHVMAPATPANETKKELPVYKPSYLLFGLYQLIKLNRMKRALVI